MAKKTITLTEEHIRLIEEIKFDGFVFNGEENNRNGDYGWGINEYGPWGGPYPIEDIARILGHWNDYIKGTEENPLGRRYPEELEEQFKKYYYDIVGNMEYILDLAFKNLRNGLQPGTYSCNPRYKDWVKID